MAEFFDELYKQIYVTFIYESRWHFFVEGFRMTILLTFSSFILGTLIGILFCKLKTSGARWVRWVMKVFTSVLIQIPTLVLLMLFVYIIFGSISLPIVISTQRAENLPEAMLKSLQDLQTNTAIHSSLPAAFSVP